MTWAAWLQVFLSTLGGGGITLVGTWIAGRQSTQRARAADRSKGREEWFRRLHWAADLANDADDRRQTAGLDMIEQLISSDLATPDDVKFALAAVRNQSQLRDLTGAFADVDEREVTVDNEDGSDVVARGEDQ